MAQLLSTTVIGDLTTTGAISEGGVKLPLKYIHGIQVAEGSHIGDIGTPTVSVSINNTTGIATFTFDYLRGVRGPSNTSTALPYSITFSDDTTTTAGSSLRCMTTSS